MAAQKDYFIGLLEAIDGRIDENGRFDFGFSFVDWPTHGRADEEEGVRSLCRMAARKAEALAGVLGGGELAGSICRKISRKCLPVNEAKQVAALKYLSGAELSGREKTLLAAGGGKGFSCFLSGQILAALEETAGAEAALDAMKEYFGGMLDMGATAFWEEFDLEWMKNSAPVTAFPRRGETDIHGDFGMHCYKGYRKSLCHGWSAGPVPFLFEKILGIRFLSAGGKEPGNTAASRPACLCGGNLSHRLRKTGSQLPEGGRKDGGFCQSACGNSGAVLTFRSFRLIMVRV